MPQPSSALMMTTFLLGYSWGRAMSTRNMLSAWFTSVSVSWKILEYCSGSSLNTSTAAWEPSSAKKGAVYLP
jgi:hypothetical protein